MPAPLFTSEATTGEIPYELLPDGRFLAFTAEATPDYPISVIVNWPALLSQQPATH